MRCRNENAGVGGDARKIACIDGRMSEHGSRTVVEVVEAAVVQAEENMLDA